LRNVQMQMYAESEQSQSSVVLPHSHQMPSVNPLVRYIDEKPAAYQAIRQAILDGLTREKYTVFLLHAHTDEVKVCDANKLRETLINKPKSITQPILAAMERRDPATGMQIFLIDQGGDAGMFMQVATLIPTPEANAPVQFRDVSHVEGGAAHAA
jgi:hypothetical protein